jgi:penicillin-binding protein-related factor A (putative recombinase)
MRSVSYEKPIENEILYFLKSIGVFAWKNQTVGVFSKSRNQYLKPRNIHHIKGVSDILGLIDGRFLAIEVKSPKGRPTPEQLEFIEKVNAQGGIAFIARSSLDVKTVLLKHFPSVFL